MMLLTPQTDQDHTRPGLAGIREGYPCPCAAEGIECAM